MKFNDHIDMNDCRDGITEHPSDNDNKFLRAQYFTTQWQLDPANSMQARQNRWKRERRKQSFFVIGIMGAIMATVMLVFLLPVLIK